MVSIIKMLWLPSNSESKLCVVARHGRYLILAGETGGTADPKISVDSLYVSIAVLDTKVAVKRGQDGYSEHSLHGWHEGPRVFMAQMSHP